MDVVYLSMYVFFVPSFFQVVSIGYHGNVVHVWERFAHHWVRTENTNQVVYLSQVKKKSGQSCLLPDRPAGRLSYAGSQGAGWFQAWAGQIASFASCSMRPSFGTRRTRLPGMQKLYDISDSFFLCNAHWCVSIKFRLSKSIVQVQILKLALKMGF